MIDPDSYSLNLTGVSTHSSGSSSISYIESFQIYSMTSRKLNGGNIMECSQHVKGKHKFGYLSGYSVGSHLRFLFLFFLTTMLHTQNFKG